MKFNVLTHFCEGDCLYVTRNCCLYQTQRVANQDKATTSPVDTLSPRMTVSYTQILNIMFFLTQKCLSFKLNNFYWIELDF